MENFPKLVKKSNFNGISIKVAQYPFFFKSKSLIKDLANQSKTVPCIPEISKKKIKNFERTKNNPICHDFRF